MCWVSVSEGSENFFLPEVNVLINSFLLSLTQIILIKSLSKKALIFEVSLARKAAVILIFSFVEHQKNYQFSTPSGFPEIHVCCSHILAVPVCFWLNEEPVDSVLWVLPTRVWWEGHSCPDVCASFSSSVAVAGPAQVRGFVLV